MKNKNSVKVVVDFILDLLYNLRKCYTLTKNVNILLKYSTSRAIEMIAKRENNPNPVIQLTFLFWEKLML